MTSKHQHFIIVRENIKYMYLKNEYDITRVREFSVYIAQGGKVYIFYNKRYKMVLGCLHFINREVHYKKRYLLKTTLNRLKLKKTVEFIAYNLSFCYSLMIKTII